MAAEEVDGSGLPEGLLEPDPVMTPVTVPRVESLLVLEPDTTEDSDGLALPELLVDCETLPEGLAVGD